MGIYLDNAATSFPKPKEVADAVYDFMINNGTSSGRGSYKKAMQSDYIVYECRKLIGNLFNFDDPKKVVFTSNVTDSLNIAIRGILKENDHVITSSLEHNAVWRCLKTLEKDINIKIDTVECSKDGITNPEDIKKYIRKDTALIVFTQASNVLGTIQPIKEITEIAHAHGALMHTDAVQACGNIPVDVKDLGVDLMSMSGHKIYGPKGIGALYIKKGVKIHNFMHGGAQERRKRAGTENVPAIVGYGKAAEMAKNNMENHVRELTRLRDKLMYGLQERIPHTRINGHKTDRLPGTANVSFQFIEGEGILLLLDQAGIAGSSGSACTSGSLDPSHVLMALGLPHELAHGSLRLVVGDFTTEEDVDYVLETLPPIIARLRELSPLYQTYIKEHPEEKK